MVVLSLFLFFPPFLMTEPKIMEDTADAASLPGTTFTLHKTSNVLKPFPKLVTVEFDSSDELQESTGSPLKSEKRVHSTT